VERGGRGGTIIRIIVEVEDTRSGVGDDPLGVGGLWGGGMWVSRVSWCVGGGGGLTDGRHFPALIVMRGRTLADIPYGYGGS